MILIGRILHPLHVLMSQDVAQCRAPFIQKRSGDDDFCPLRPDRRQRNFLHSGEPVPGRTLTKPHQNRLTLVVFGVAKQQMCPASLPQGTREQTMAGPARIALTLHGSIPDEGAVRHIQARAGFGDELGFLSGFGPQAVIHSQSQKLTARTDAPRMRAAEKRQGIAAARHRYANRPRGAMAQSVKWIQVQLSPLEVSQRERVRSTAARSRVTSDAFG